MFKIPDCDFSIGVQSICSRYALAQLVLWSQYDLPAVAVVALLPYSVCARSILRSHMYCDCTSTVLRLYRQYCDQGRSRATALRVQNERTETIGDRTAHADSVTIVIC